MIWMSLISPVAKLAGSFIEQQTTKQKAKATLAQTEADAKSEILKSAAQHDSKWELIMAESTRSSIKDEIITIAVLAPAAMAWIDPELAKRGFDVIAELPSWYTNILYITILAGLGLKGLDRFKRK